MTVHTVPRRGRTAVEDQTTVLVIDDDQAVVEMIATGLEIEGVRVVSASDGSEGIDVLTREHVDVVVLDIMMPGVDGWMALMDIRNNPATADVPVLVLTAKNEELARVLAFKQGVQQYVTKPCGVAELSARIDSLVRWSSRVPEPTVHPTDGDFRKLAVRKGGRTVLLGVEDVVFLSARNKSTYAHTFENQYLVDMTLGDLEQRLSRDSFVRVHRSYLVNLNAIKEILRVEGSYVVVGGDRDETHIPVARRQVKTFRDAVGI
jgi:DNA-binding response OmpR family regulator